MSDAPADDGTSQGGEPAHAPMTLYVCTTCRGPDDGVGDGGPRPGARLYAALAALPVDPAITIEPVECLSVCKRVCTVAFAAPGKWTYVYGDLPAEGAAEIILEGAQLYAQAEHGLIPWRLRPAVLKTGVVSRVPPLPCGPAP